MKTSKYWQQRFIQLTESLLNKGDRYYDDLIEEYEKAIQKLERDIITFYERFAENNEVSLVEAKRMLSAKELKEFFWTVEEYIEKGRENSLDQRWMKELENASIRVRMSRLEALQLQMRQHVETISAHRLAGMTKLATEVMEDGYYRTIFEVQKGLGMGNTFSNLDIKTIEATISKPWAPDGSNFSSRIWKDREMLMNELQKELTQSFIRGDAPDEAIRNIAKKMDVSKKAAGRLVMTEAAYFAGESRAKAFKELGVEEYQFIATLDDKTSDICQEMDLKVFKLSDREVGVNWPPLHCWCRSTCAPHYEDNKTTRFARDPSTGARYYVDGDMTYKEWYNEYVTKKAENAFQSLIGVTTSNGIEIKEVSIHVVKQAVDRNVSVECVRDALLNPLQIGKIKIDEYNRPSRTCIGEKATVAVNPQTGNIITVYPTSSNRADKLKKELKRE